MTQPEFNADFRPARNWFERELRVDANAGLVMGDRAPAVQLKGRDLHIRVVKSPQHLASRQRVPSEKRPVVSVSIFVMPDTCSAPCSMSVHIWNTMRAGAVI